MKVHGTGKVYVNFMTDWHGHRVTDAYNPRTLHRLAAIKAMYDPHNRFRMNQNISPTAR
jgi:FAD/FMN-containing dehydrogenase